MNWQSDPAQSVVTSIRKALKRYQLIAALFTRSHNQ
jgi:hypothetical protein